MDGGVGGGAGGGALGGGTGGGGALGGGTGGGGSVGGGGGSDDAGAGGGSADAGVRTIVVRNTKRLIGETGAAVDVNVFAPQSVTVFLTDGTSVLQELPGTDGVDGYTVPDVPAGAYVVRYGNGFLVTSDDSVDLGYEDIGRAGIEQVDAGTATLDLTVTGLPAWNLGDDLMLYSVGAELYANGSWAQTAGPAEGQVPSNFVFDYGALWGTSTPRIDASKGDSLWLAHMRAFSPAADLQPDGGTLPITCSKSAATAHLTSLTIEPGTNTAAANFTESSPAMINVSWPRAQWAARATEVHPQAQEYAEQLYVTASPQPWNTSADLVSCLNWPDLSLPLTDVVQTVLVDDPYDSSWARATGGAAYYNVSASVADAGVWSSTASLATSNLVAGSAVAPGVHSPADVMLQGNPAATVETAAASSPVAVTWTPSSTAPVATSFSVQLLRMTKPNGTTVRSVVTSASTPGHAFTFPAGSLVAGGIYFVRVRALVQEPNTDAPRFKHTTSYADAMSRPFIAK